MIDVSVWTAELATRIAGAPNETLRQELEGTMREFFVSSGSWLTQSPAMDVVAQQDTYTIPAIPDGILLYTYAILIDETLVRFTGTQVPGTFKLRQTPSQAKTGAMVAVVAIRPTQYDTVPVETETYDFDTILDGAMGRLYNMPDRPWSNTPNAEYHLKRFRVGMGRARVRTRGGFTNHDEGFRFPPWT